MHWISLILFSYMATAAELPRFLTKHAPETLRYISMDGRYAYVQKKPGVLGLISSYRSVDFITDSSSNNFLVRTSRFKERVAIESIPNAQSDFNLLKDHRIYVVNYGNSIPKEIGMGRSAKLHLKDEWISYYGAYSNTIYIQNIVTQKKYDIRLSKKANPFFIPEVEMISDNIILYTDINEDGYAALVTINLSTKKSTIHYKSTQTATRLELCSQSDYLAIGEFPYDGVTRGSKILHLKTKGVINLAGYTTIYNSVEQDIGNMVCMNDSIYFIKTLNQDKTLNHKITDVVKLDLKTQKIEVKSDLNHVNQLLEMDGRIMIPLRGEFYVVEGKWNLGSDTLKSAPKEELRIDI